MDILKQFVSFKTNNIKGIRSKSGEPTTEQLIIYVTGLIDQLMNQIIAHAPQHITTICRNGIEKMGWDLDNKCVIPDTPFNVDTVIVGLNSIMTAISTIVPSTEPSATELQDISKAANRLWELDVNRLVPGTDYVINLQKGKKIYDTSDVARDPLFTFVDLSNFEKPTFKTFINLLDNYVASTGVAEVVTNEEKRENMEFLNAIMNTPVMNYCHKYLAYHNKAPRERDAFIRLLNELWFGLYRREVSNDSSGFEHVFLGEIKDGVVSGL